MTLRRCLHPNPWNREYGTLYGKRDFADVTKLKIWGWRIVLGCLGGPRDVMMEEGGRSPRSEGAIQLELKTQEEAKKQGEQEAS